MKKFILVLLPLISLALSFFHISGSIESNDGVTKEGIAGYKILKPREWISKKIKLSGPNAILQDGSGWYWIADPSGLYRYDEKQNLWTVELTQGVGLIGKTAKKVWIGNVDNQKESPWCYDQGKWYQRADCGISHLKGQVRAMFTSPNNKMWVVTDSNELVACDGEQCGLPIEVPRLKLGYAKSVFEDSQGYVWIGAPEQLLCYDPSHQCWKHYDYPEKFDSAKGIYEDRDGRIWLTGLADVVAVFDKAKTFWTCHTLSNYLPKGVQSPDEIEPLPSELRIVLVRGVYQNKNKKMIIGTNKGLVIFDEEKNKLDLFTSKNSALPSNYVTALMEDLSGRIWIGTTKGIIILE